MPSQESIKYDSYQYARVKEAPIERLSFIQREKSSPSLTHELIFAVKQNGIDKLANIVTDISDPRGKAYQQWLNFDEVGKITGNPEGTKAIIEWLSNTYSSNDDLQVDKASIVWKSFHGDYIKATASISHWEKLLQTEFFEYHDQQRNTKGGGLFAVHHRAKHYSLPVHLHQYVFAVFNTVQTPPMWRSRYQSKLELEKSSQTLLSSSFKTLFRASSEVNTLASKSSCANKEGSVTVPFLNCFYQIASNIGNMSLSQSVVETSDESYSPYDLTTFQKYFGLKIQSAKSIGGHAINNCSTITNNCNEGNLDIQYIMGVAQATTSIFWWKSEKNSNPFTAWMTDVANDPHPPQASSISWGSVEQFTSPSEMSAFNTEALKASARGVTIVVASGDDGALNRDDSGICMCGKDSSSSSLPNYKWSGSNSWSGSGYFPSFPATSPWVTAVGASMGPETGSGEAEQPCLSQSGGGISSGGGFSTFFPQPSWQKDAVARYFNLSRGSPPVAGFNPQGRAIPDVTLLGRNYHIIVGGRHQYVSGTSASAPVFAAFVSLVNAARRLKGLPSIGFLNPTLYATGMNASTAALFHDMVSGSNHCCGSSGGSAKCCGSGFNSASGWDPVTGWGSITYKNFAGVFSVASPYNVVYTESSDGSPSLRISLVFLMIAAGVLTLVLCSFFYICYKCFCRRREVNMNHSVETIPTAPVVIIGGEAAQPQPYFATVHRSPSTTGTYASIPRSSAGTVVVRANPVVAV
mmetsp:Transcript_31520/g.45379  ORF Transcript_31520/g.45379 Transcript_31520/m.45379 type:complete len:749 (-) Transcript_31520:235-2481(-)